jgi:N-glycosylase/DNA lyase
LASGQTFAFFPGAGGSWGVSDGRPVWVGAGAKAIRCRAEDEAFWRKYFEPDRDYAEMLAPYLGSDPALAACANAFAGIRLLRQPVWEAVCAFIISANNHQKRIESIYRRLSERYGGRIIWEGRTFYGFPSPQRLAQVGEQALHEAGLGYRAPYIASTAATVADGFSLDLDAMEYEAALAHLTQLRGVGEKVADCVLLFASRHSRAFPVDVWMERVLTARYGFGGTRAKMKKEAQGRFGDCAGIIQQYLFHGARTGLLSVDILL